MEKITKFSQPKGLGHFPIKSEQVLYYLYYPVKWPGLSGVSVPRQLAFATPLLLKVLEDEPERTRNEYIYITAKKMYIGGGVTANRPGWHCDGFMSDDLNYVWYDNTPTVFNCGQFSISPDHKLSLEEFALQARAKYDYICPNEHLLKLDSSVIHRVNLDVPEQIMRTFVKLTVSKERFNLKDNSINYAMIRELGELPMYDRAIARNDPYQAQKDSYTPPVIDDHLI